MIVAMLRIGLRRGETSIRNRRKIMHRFALVAIAGAMLLPALCQARPVAAADASAIRAVIDRQRDAWNRHDMDAFVADTTPDVDWVNIVGMH
jgi:hypothetical protein